uniref:Uncharacterized protein n=1 Tax=Anopheles epiroticus TaxID=199890 RepID=A0A182PWS8_9DIPT
MRELFEQEDDCDIIDSTASSTSFVHTVEHTLSDNSSSEDDNQTETMNDTNIFVNMDVRECLKF